MNDIIEFEQGGVAFVGMPKGDFEQIMSDLEDLRDVELIENAKNNNEECFPLELTKKIIEGDSPIKIYREYRGLSRASLGKIVNVSGQYIGMIENGIRTGEVSTLKAIAEALDVDLDMII